jgi:hypothetical protein
MRHAVATYVLALITLASLAAMYVLAFVIGAEPLPLGLVIVAVCLAAVGALVALGASLPLVRPRAADVASATVASALTLLLSREMGIPALVSISLVAILLGVMAAPTGPLDVRAEGAGYAGAFVGLLDPSITVPIAWLILAGAVSGALWSVIGPSVLPGIGGRLGLVAFMASAAIYGVASAIGAEQPAVLIPAVDGLRHLAMIPVGAAGAVITWMLIQRRGWDFAIASGLTSLVVCGGVYLSGMGELAPVLSTAWFGGTMVGLSAPARLPNAGWVGLAGMVYGSFMLHFEGPLQGHVGIIGATGVIAVLVTMGAIRVRDRGASYRVRRAAAPEPRLPA